PMLAAAQTDPRRQFWSAVACADGAGLIFLLSAWHTSVSLWDVIQVYLLMIAWVLALWGTWQVLVRLRINPTLAATMVMLLAGAWLTWPLWLSAAMTDRLVSTLTPVHPLMAVNTAVSSLGLWTEQAGVLYSLT